MPALAQVGIPSSREQYIHRLGRTARAGRTGRGLLLLMPEERHFLRQLNGGCRRLPLPARLPACCRCCRSRLSLCEAASTAPTPQGVFT